MAKPIKHTPVLKGQDAVNFLNKIEENKNKKVSEATLVSIRNDAQKLRAILKVS